MAKNEDKVIKEIEAEVLDLRSTEKGLQSLQDELMENDRFLQFLELQKTVQEESDKLWNHVQEEMIKHDIKQIKGDFGTLTIAERQGWDIDIEQLPAKFIKKVADTKKITLVYQLEGKAPKGCDPKTTKYLTKRLKI